MGINTVIINIMLKDLTKEELTNSIEELESKYKKLLKLAKKLGDEMDYLHDEYIKIQEELRRRNNE